MNQGNWVELPSRQESVGEIEETSSKIACKDLTKEVKRVAYIAGPMVAVSLSQYMLQFVSLIMVGHLGDSYAFSGTALAISLATVIGFSFLLGMASALETLCGQAYGAKQYRKVRIHTYSAVFTLILTTFPLSLLWIFMEKILLLLRQNPHISFEAGRFMRSLLPALFAYAFLQPLVRYFQTQSLITPLLITASGALCLHIPLCWVLVFHSGLGHIGAAIAMDLAYWLMVIFLGMYMKYSAACAKTSAPISVELFYGIKGFIRLAIPSAVMICLEYWSFNLVVLLSALLPNPELETSVLSVCLNTLNVLYTIPIGLGAGVSTRVSNELGAGNPQAARIAVYTIILLTATITVMISSTLLACRNLFGHIFSNDKKVVNYVSSMAPLVSLSVFLDSIQGVLSGIARGCGWQHIGAYINLGAFYICGVPVAATLAFAVHLKGKGLWMGLLIGEVVQALLLLIVTCRMNYIKQASKARERTLTGPSAVQNVSA